MPEYVVYAIPPGEFEQIPMGCWELERWQFAVKYAAHLESKDYTDVEIRLETGHDEED